MDSIINLKRPEVVRVTINRLTTIDGYGETRGLRIGDTKLVRPNTARKLEIVNKNGRAFGAIVVDEVDVNGKYLGWIYADLFIL